MGAKKNIPGVDTDVYQYRDWIKVNSGNSLTPILILGMTIFTFLFYGSINSRELVFN